MKTARAGFSLKNSRALLRPSRPLSGFFLFGIFLCFLSGCSQPLRTLMDLGAERKAQEDFVAKRARDFERLRRDMETGRVGKGAGRREIIAQYGEAVLEKTPPAGCEGGVTLLYRHPVIFFGAEKVYLDFDKDDRLAAVRMEEDGVGGNP